MWVQGEACATEQSRVESVPLTLTLAPSHLITFELLCQANTHWRQTGLGQVSGGAC